MDEITTREVQEIRDGVGPLYHRIYAVEFPADEAAVREAMRQLQSEIDLCSPTWLASFKKVNGAPVGLRRGDEFEVKLLAPWKAPVRVKEASSLKFTLVTLDGHLEAGEIRFCAVPARNGIFRFEIESLARSKDHVIDFFYDKLPIARFAQTEMWSDFCRNFVELVSEVEGRELPEIEVDVRTEKREPDSKTWVTI